ncbi:MAG: hypothetical protein ACP5KB_04280 [Thermoprotei archaeon]
MRLNRAEDLVRILNSDCFFLDVHSDYFVVASRGSTSPTAFGILDRSWVAVEPDRTTLLMGSPHRLGALLPSLSRALRGFPDCDHVTATPHPKAVASGYLPSSIKINEARLTNPRA